MNGGDARHAGCDMADERWPRHHVQPLHVADGAREDAVYDEEGDGEGDEGDEEPGGDIGDETQGEKDVEVVGQEHLARHGQSNIHWNIIIPSNRSLTQPFD